MSERRRAAGPIAKRIVAIVGFLPAPIQAFVYRATYQFARFLVLILVLPVLIVVFIVSTLIFAIVNAVLAPSGLVGGVLAYAWLASWTVLPVIITVRMWRAVPILRTLIRTATEGPDRPGTTDQPLGTFVRHEATAQRSFESRVSAADATLASDDPRPDPHEPPARVAR